MNNSARIAIALTLAFVIALAVTVLFTYRVGRQVRHIHTTTEPIQPWMSIPFIAHTRHVPAPLLYQAIGVPPEPHDRRPIRKLARELNRPEPQVLAQVQQAVNAAEHSTDKQPQ